MMYDAFITYRHDQDGPIALAGVGPGSRTRGYGRSRNWAAYSAGVRWPRPVWWRWRL